ncbi:MAG TPA: aminotransferase class V-fold PLP-dependent enzyme [Polyangiaceae bacterium]|jgi:kynureninase|nr:aminotransferase class V-fold PLP-dependent enzyme [Polyangiaceae bacterium]
MTSLDFSRYRERFPIFKERIYFANQCMGPFPADGYRDLEEYVGTRRLHSRALGAWLERIEEVTGLIEQLLHAPSGSVALRDSATACQAAIASAIVPSAKRNRIVVSALDFHSSLHLWRAQERRGFEVVVVPGAPDGFSVVPEEIVRQIDERVAAVAISTVSRNSGLIDVTAILGAARRAGALTVLDAYQAVGCYPMDVSTLGADVVVGGCLKWLSGETGLAFMYVRPSLSEQTLPAYPGWFGHSELHAFVHTHEFIDQFAPMPGARRFQQGTPGMAPIYGARAGLRFVLEVGVEAMREKNAALTEYLFERCLERGFEVRTPRAGSARVGGICLAPPDPEATVAALAREGIDVDQRRLTLVRLAPHPCATFEECDRVVAVLEKAIKH